MQNQNKEVLMGYITKIRLGDKVHWRRAKSGPVSSVPRAGVILLDNKEIGMWVRATEQYVYRMQFNRYTQSCVVVAFSLGAWRDCVLKALEDLLKS